MRKAWFTFNVSIALALTTLGYSAYSNNGPLEIFALLWILVDTIAYIKYAKRIKRITKNDELLDD